MRISDLQKVWVDADSSAAHASILWDTSLEAAYAELREAAGRVLVALGQDALLETLESQPHYYNP